MLNIIQKAHLNAMRLDRLSPPQNGADLCGTLKTSLENTMRSNVVDYRVFAISRRAFLQGAGLALAAGFTALSDCLLNWLMRVCRFGSGDLRPAAAG